MDETIIRLILALTVLAKVFGGITVVYAAWLMRQIYKWLSESSLGRSLTHTSIRYEIWHCFWQ